MKREYEAKATVSGKKRFFGMFLAGLVMCICVVALMFTVYSFMTGNIAFGVSYIIAILLGLSYIVIKFNQFFSTYIAADEDNLILKCWENHFFPYNAWNGVPVLREFIPAKSEIVTVPMKEIKTLMIGSKSTVKRNANDADLNKELTAYEKHKYSATTAMLNKTNILYIRTQNDESCYMNLDGFNPKEVMGVINKFSKLCDDSVDIRISNREYKRYLKRGMAKKENTEEVLETEE